MRGRLGFPGYLSYIHGIIIKTNKNKGYEKI